MGWFRGAPKTQVDYNDPLLDDARWMSAGEGRYRDAVSKYYGSPDTIAAGGTERMGQGDPAAALFFYQKAIDTMHSNYVFLSQGSSPAEWRRQPSPVDLSIIDGYLGALSRVREVRPGAVVTGSVQEVTHRLRTISSFLDRNGLDPQPYLDRLDRLAQTAPDVDVSQILWN